MTGQATSAWRERLRFSLQRSNPVCEIEVCPTTLEPAAVLHGYFQAHEVLLIGALKAGFFLYLRGGQLLHHYRAFRKLSVSCILAVGLRDRKSTRLNSSHV